MGQLSEDLITDELVDEFILVLQDKLAPFNAFSTRVVDGPLMVKESGIAGYLTEKSGTAPTVAEITAATAGHVDFQTSAATNAAITLNTKYHWASSDITYVEQMAGIPFATAIPNMVHAIANDVWDEVLQLVTSAAFTQVGATVATGALDADDIQACWAAAKLSANASVITTRANYKNLLPDTLDSFQLRTSDGVGAFGLLGNIYYVDDMAPSAGGDAETETWVLDPQAIVGAQGVPAQAAQVATSAQISERVITEPNSGFNFLLSEWVDPQTKGVWMQIACVAGYAAGDATALVRASTDGA